MKVYNAVLAVYRWYGDGAGDTIEENFSIFFLIQIGVISKGMWAVKQCSNKILQFLTGGGGAI